MHTKNSGATNVNSTIAIWCFTLFVSFSSGLLSTASNAQAITQNTYQLAPFESQFEAYYDGDTNPVGYALLRFTQLPNKLWQLEYESKISKYFLTDKRTETTRYLFQPNDLAEQLALTPITYVYERTGTGSDKGLSVTFDQAKNQFFTSVPVDKKVVFPLNGYVDNQLFRIDVPYQLAMGKTQFSYQFVNSRGQARNYGMQVVNTESQALPIGVLETIKVVINRESSTRQTFAWFAPSLNYQLVRLQQFKDGAVQGDIKLRVHKAL